MAHQVKTGLTTSLRRGWLPRLGGVSAAIAAALLLIGMINLAASVLRPGVISSWLSLFGDNWLVRIFILHAGISDVHADLHGLSFLDVFILLLVGVLCLSLSAMIRKAGRVWLLIALALCVIAILLFLATQLAGRSTVMLAVLIISFVLLKDKALGKVAVYSGMLASIFLFVGDLTVGVQSGIITALFGIGYVLLMIWFFLIARALLEPVHTP